jgi:hypothetical protein
MIRMASRDDAKPGSLAMVTRPKGGKMLKSFVLWFLAAVTFGLAQPSHLISTSSA